MLGLVLLSSSGILDCVSKFPLLHFSTQPGSQFKRVFSICFTPCIVVVALAAVLWPDGAQVPMPWVMKTLVHAIFVVIFSFVFGLSLSYWWSAGLQVCRSKAMGARILHETSFKAI